MKATALVEAFKRLSMFGDYIAFDGEKVVTDGGFEPFNFKAIEGRRYEIERVKKLLETATDIAETSGNLILKNNASKFLISAVEEE